MRSEVGIALAKDHPEGFLAPFEVIVERGSDLTLAPFPPIIKTVGDFQVPNKRKNMYRMA
jgi:hypothetical protein